MTARVLANCNIDVILKMSKRVCHYVVACVFLFVGLAILLLALFLLPVLRDHILDKKLHSDAVLKEGSDAFNEWKSPSTPVQYVLTVYNVTNSEDVVKNKTKPNVFEVGPYYYRKHKQKTNITFNQDGTVVKYKSHDVYVFDRDSTPAHLDPDKDVITTLNIPFMAAINGFIRGEVSTFEMGGMMLEAAPEVFVKHTTTELVWGYQDKLTRFLNSQKKLPTPTFGLFANDSDKDWSTYSSVRTGTDDLSDVGQYVTWRGQSTLPYWKGKYANMINGTDGTFFHPHLNKLEDVLVFVDSLFRSVNLTYQKSVSRYSVSLYRYVIPHWELLNDTVYPLNAEWYANWFYGLLNLTSPEQAPIFMSKPRFLDATPEFRTNLTGMKEPDDESDNTMMDAEPLTGFVFNVHKRLQINVRLQQNSGWLLWSPVANVRDTLVPIVFVDETASASKSTCDEFVDKVYKPIKIVNDVRWALVALGSAMVVVSASLMICWTLRKKRLGQSLDEMRLISSEHPSTQDF